LLPLRLWRSKRPLILKLALDYMKCWQLRFFDTRLARQS